MVQLSGSTDNQAADTRGEPLFTMQIDSADDPSITIPLSVFAGDNAEVLAAQFSETNKLDSNTRDELTLAIIEYAKTQGAVPPIFALQVELPDGTVAPLNVYKGDKPRELAAIFARRHSLPTQPTVDMLHAQIVRRAKAGGHVQPLMVLNVTTTVGMSQFVLYEGDQVAEGVAVFAEAQNLTVTETVRLQKAVIKQLKQRKLVTPVLEMPVDLGPSHDSQVAKLVVYDGEVMEQVAIEFSEQHSLGWMQQQAVLRMLDDQLTAKHLLPPLLATVSYTFEPGPEAGAGEQLVARIPVHEGDQPEAVAFQFVAQVRPPAPPAAQQHKTPKHTHTTHTHARAACSLLPAHTHLQLPSLACLG